MKSLYLTSLLILRLISTFTLAAPLPGGGQVIAAAKNLADNLIQSNTADIEKLRGLLPKLGRESHPTGSVSEVHVPSDELEKLRAGARQLQDEAQ